MASTTSSCKLTATSSSTAPATRSSGTSGTNGNPGAFAAMQGDGNLVVYSSTGKALWASGTQGHPAPTSSSMMKEFSKSSIRVP